MNFEEILKFEKDKALDFKVIKFLREYDKNKDKIDEAIERNNKYKQYRVELVEGQCNSNVIAV